MVYLPESMDCVQEANGVTAQANKKARKTQSARATAGTLTHSVLNTLLLLPEVRKHLSSSYGIQAYWKSLSGHSGNGPSS